MNGLDTYKEVAITTQNKERVVVLLYEGAIKFLKLAIKALQDNDMATKGLYINKALAIVDELNRVLDMEIGGEIAMNLRQLYHFMIRQLNVANIQKDTQKIQQVINLLEELNQGWKEIA